MRVVEIIELGPVDKLGRAQFVAAWEANNVGPACNEVGTRYQVFFMDVAEFIERERGRGAVVEFREEIAGFPLTA